MAKFGCHCLPQTCVERPVEASRLGSDESNWCRQQDSEGRLEERGPELMQQLQVQKRGWLCRVPRLARPRVPRRRKTGTDLKQKRWRVHDDKEQTMIGCYTTITSASRALRIKASKPYATYNEASLQGGRALLASMTETVLSTISVQVPSLRSRGPASSHGKIPRP